MTRAELELRLRALVDMGADMQAESSGPDMSYYRHVKAGVDLAVEKLLDELKPVVTPQPLGELLKGDL